ncbi:hypothetical protein AAC387_Pa02g0300 [Persea americana]
MESSCDSIRTLAQLYRNLKGRFLRSERRKSSNFTFTAAVIGSKVDFPVFLLSEKRKTGNYSFTAALIGGKADFPVFLRSERSKTGNCRYVVGTCGGDLSI